MLLLRVNLDERITVDERFGVEPRVVHGRVMVERAAGVVPLGGVLRPAVRARLNNHLFTTGKQIKGLVEADATVRFGLVAWGADNEIVRIHTYIGIDLGLEAGDFVLASQPMPEPGNRVVDEARIFLASKTLEKFGALAQPGALVSETMAAAPASVFMERLARLYTARMRMILLRHQISEAGVR